MNKTLVFYYSATGNTRRAVGVLEQVFRARDWQVAVAELDQSVLAAPAPEALAGLAAGDLLVVAFPVLGFSSPYPVLSWVRRLPKTAPGVRAVVLCACGATMVNGQILPGWAGGATLTIARVLRNKGYQVLGIAEASYPENWTQVSNPPYGKEAEAMQEQGDGQARKFAQAILSGQVVHLKRNPFGVAVAQVVGVVFRNLASRFLGILFMADTTCTGCGWCARTCPARAITMKSHRPVWNVKCSACNRCINGCPARAIQTSVARLVLLGGLNIVALVLVWSVSAAVLAGLGTGEGGTPAWLSWVKIPLGIVLYCAITLLQISPLNLLLSRLERVPARKSFFGMAFTRNFRRYLAPGMATALRIPPERTKKNEN